MPQFLVETQEPNIISNTHQSRIVIQPRNWSLMWESPSFGVSTVLLSFSSVDTMVDDVLEELIMTMTMTMEADLAAVTWTSQGELEAFQGRDGKFDGWIDYEAQRGAQIWFFFFLLSLSLNF